MNSARILVFLHLAKFSIQSLNLGHSIRCAIMVLICIFLKTDNNTFLLHPRKAHPIVIEKVNQKPV